MFTRKCVIAIALLACGCAAHKPEPKAQALPITTSYASVPAGSLVFDPPVIVGQPPLQLSRDDRAPSAFAGYDSTTATYFYVRTDDRQTSDRSDRYERRSITEKTGVSYR